MNPHEILGVNKTASKEEIKKAYKRKAMILHPDRGGDKDKFNEAKDAYETLINGDKKKPSNSIDAHAMSLLGHLFNSIIDAAGDNIFTIDVVKMARNKIEENITGFKLGDRQSGKKIEKLTKLNRRMITKNKRVNIFGNLLEQQIDAEKRAIESNEHNLKVANLMLEILDDYEFSYDTAAPFGGFGGGFVEFTTTSSA